MRVRTCLFVMVAAALVCMPATMAEAQVAALSNVDRGGFAPGQNSCDAYMIGWSFTPTTDIAVTDLGVFDFSNNGYLTANTSVAIWRYSDAALMGSVALTNSISASNDFVWGTLASSINLASGTEYVIASQGVGEQYEYTYLTNIISLTVASDITFGDSHYTKTTALVMPAKTPGYEYGFIGPNFKYAEVPEPMTMSLLAMGGMAMLGRRRRK